MNALCGTLAPNFEGAADFQSVHDTIVSPQTKSLIDDVLASGMTSDKKSALLIAGAAALLASAATAFAVHVGAGVTIDSGEIALDPALVDALGRRLIAMT